MVLAALLLTGLALSFLLAAGDDDDDPAEGDAPETVRIGGALRAYQEGGGGDDSLFGTEGGDFVAGDDGDDRIFGRAGDDLLFGESDDDFLRGGRGDDFIVGGLGNDTLYGDAGNDTITANNTVDDEIYVATVRSSDPIEIRFDLSRETGEADSLFAGAGDDLAVVGGNDVATLGTGADQVFVGYWMGPDDIAEVTDFVPGEDIIVYEYDQREPAPAIGFGEDEDGNALVLFDGAPHLLLRGVDMMALSRPDIFTVPRDLSGAVSG